MINKIFGKNNTFIIAELSANHNNDFNLAVKTIIAMGKAGADAVKVQTFTPDSLTLDVDNEYFGPRKEGLWKGYRPHQLFQEAMMPWDWQPKLKEIAENEGLIFFSSPFDIKGVDFLEAIQVPTYKVASLEITDIPLIRYMASKGKPMIISAGVAEINDIELAIDACKAVDNHEIALLKCTSEYPAPIEAANLLTIPDMRNRFNVTVGISDHTMGSTVPIVAVSLGAKIIEKHFILDRKLGGPDSAFSMEPNEFQNMVRAVREAESALGNVTYEVTEKNKLRRRSLFVVEDIKKGEIITKENVRSIRPGFGLHPKFLGNALGKATIKNLSKGTPLSFADFE